MTRQEIVDWLCQKPYDPAFWGVADAFRRHIDREIQKPLSNKERSRACSPGRARAERAKRFDSEGEAS